MNIVSLHINNAQWSSGRRTAILIQAMPLMPRSRYMFFL